jgi:recombination protein RecA
MAPPKKTKEKSEVENKNLSGSQLDDFSQELIRQLNKEHGSNIAFNLSSDDAPTDVRRWISTGSKELDYIVSNRRDGGFPEGRIVEIQGPPSCGKSHIGFEVAKATQRLGGMVVYVDTENATSITNLSQLGIDVARRFVFVQTACTEEILSVIESTIMKARSMTKDVPVTVIWDSVSQSSPKAELEGDYDQNTIGLQARVLSKGMRKIANVIGGQKVLLLLMSQQRTKIGVMYGDPTTTSGGMAVPYAASTRVKINTGQPVKDKDGNVIGIEVTAKTIKNKVGRPFREATFQIHFGVGVVDHENLFDSLRLHCDAKGEANVNGVLVSISGASTWKEWKGVDAKTGEVVFEKKFYKSDFDKILRDPQYKEYMDGLMDEAFIMKPLDDSHISYKGVDPNSVEEVQAASLGDSEG